MAALEKARLRSRWERASPCLHSREKRLSVIGERRHLACIAASSGWAYSCCRTRRRARPARVPIGFNAL